MFICNSLTVKAMGKPSTHLDCVHVYVIEGGLLNAALQLQCFNAPLNKNLIK